MKKLTALILVLCLTMMSACALADTAYGRLKQKIATRTGPGTEYMEPGTFLGKGDTVTVHTRVWDSVNEIWWVQVEFTAGGDRYRAYTGSWRMDVDLSRVPQEKPLGTCRVIADADVFAGPGWEYVMWNDTVYRGTWATLLEVENGYGHIECWNAQKGQYWRVWAPLRDLDCGADYSSYHDTYPSYSYGSTQPSQPSRPAGGSYGSRVGQICRITVNTGNARSGAGADYRAVDTVYWGECFTILDTAVAYNGVTWYQICSDGYYCWISSGLTNYGLE